MVAPPLGVAAASPEARVAIEPPLEGPGVAARHPQPASHPFTLLFFSFSFFLFCFFFKKKYIYLFFNNFFFIINMDMCRHLIGLTWR
jgi:hypothetical protein